MPKYKHDHLTPELLGTLNQLMEGTAFLNDELKTKARAIRVELFHPLSTSDDSLHHLRLTELSVGTPYERLVPFFLNSKEEREILVNLIELFDTGRPQRLSRELLEVCRTSEECALAAEYLIVTDQLRPSFIKLEDWKRRIRELPQESVFKHFSEIELMLGKKSVTSKSPQ